MVTDQLCAALDAGHDDALPLLADALEEAGDPRAHGLRQAIAEARCPGPIDWWEGRPRHYEWLPRSLPTLVGYPWQLPLGVFGRLAGGGSYYRTPGTYATRSAAWLDLAAALIAEE